MLTLFAWFRFCHWPQPAWRKPDGSWQPALTNFTSLADPAAVGSGKVALTTLMHEAGHAAHFANIDMPSPLFAQERAPTSVACTWARKPNVAHKPLYLSIKLPVLFTSSVH